MAIAVPAMPVAPGADQLARPPDRRSHRLRPPLDRPVHALGPAGIGGYSLAQATNPGLCRMAQRRRLGAGLGHVEPRGDGRITVGCYLYDVAAGRELARQGFAVAAADWRRAAHKCADTDLFAPVGRRRRSSTAASSISPRPGPRPTAMKRLAIMDSDGANHRYLTTGRATVVTPRFSPARRQARLHELPGPPPARLS